MYQAIYKCRLCGEEFSLEQDINALDEKYENYLWINFSKIPLTKHSCQDGSLGLADFQGFKKAEG